MAGIPGILQSCRDNMVGASIGYKKGIIFVCILIAYMLMSFNQSTYMVHQSPMASNSHSNEIYNETAYLISMLNMTDNITNDLLIPLSIDSFRRSRVVQGDVSRFRMVLHKIKNLKQCIYGLVLGGSVSHAHGVENPKYNVYYKYLERWLNDNYPCKSNNNNKHILTPRIESKSVHGAILTTNEKINGIHLNFYDETAWSNYSCDPFDLYILETATNSMGRPKNIFFNEVLIRNLLLCKSTAAIIGLQCTTSTFYEPTYLQQLPVQQYYLIPTISFASVIYPLTNRYYLNGFKLYNTSRFHNGTNIPIKPWPQSGLRITEEKMADRLYFKFPYLFKKHMVKYHSNNSKLIERYYKNIDYSDEAHGGHLRLDRIHPTISGHKFIFLLLEYFFLTEYKQMKFETDILKMNDFDVYFKNEIIISPSIDSLPPIAFLDQYAATWNTRIHSAEFKRKKEIYLYLANHHFIQPYQLWFTDPNTYGFSYEPFKQSVTQNEGLWVLRPETIHAKYGLICNQTIICKLSLRVNYAKKKEMKTNNQKLILNVVYLKSYQHMGTCMVWIDNQRHITNNSNPDSNSKDKVIYLDALDLNDKTSQEYSRWWMYYPPKNKEIFIHFMIIPSVPQRMENKFKLLKIGAMTVH